MLSVLFSPVAYADQHHEDELFRRLNYTIELKEKDEDHLDIIFNETMKTDDSLTYLATIELGSSYKATQGMTAKKAKVIYSTLKKNEEDQVRNKIAYQVKEQTSDSSWKVTIPKTDLVDGMYQLKFAITGTDNKEFTESERSNMNLEKIDYTSYAETSSYLITLQIGDIVTIPKWKSGGTSAPIELTADVSNSNVNENPEEIKQTIINQLPAQTRQVKPEPIKKEDDSSGIGYIIFLVLLAGGVGAGGYYYYTKIHKKEN